MMLCRCAQRMNNLWFAGAGEWRAAMLEAGGVEGRSEVDFLAS